MSRVIIACTDPSGPSRRAVDWAEREARLRGLPAPVVLAVPPDPGRVEMVVCGVPGPSDAGDPDPGLRLPAAVRAGGRPLVLVPDGSARPPRSERILLGTDARRASDDVIGFAFDSARAHGALLHVVHAWSLPSCAAEWPFGVPEAEHAIWEDHEVQLLADVLRPWRERYPQVPVYEDVLLLAAAQALLHHADGASLAVVGARPGEEWGEVVRLLLRRGSCPVAVVPARTARTTTPARTTS